MSRQNFKGIKFNEGKSDNLNEKIAENPLITCFGATPR